MSDPTRNPVMEYVEKIDTTLRHGYATMLLAIGFKLKLFDFLGNETEPRTSIAIAELAKLKERYVQDWLNGLVVARFIECDPSGQKYWMTNAAKDALKSQSIQISIKMARIFTYEIKVFDEICECFQPDGPRGMPYSAYGDIHEAIGGVTGALLGQPMIQNTIPSIPGLQEKLESGIKCLDIGCGIAEISFILAARFPKSQFYGVDLFQHVIDDNMKRVKEKGLSNLHFVAADAVQLPREWSSTFEYTTASYAIHDLARADLALKEIVRVLKPGGQFSMFELAVSSNVHENINNSVAKLFYPCGLFHCTAVSMYFPDGLGLGIMMGKEKAISMLKEAGFAKVEFTNQPWEQNSAHFLCAKAGEGN